MDKLRTVRLSPYRRGTGPTFTLTLWDTNKPDLDGRWSRTRFAYRLTMGRTILFSGDNFSGPAIRTRGDYDGCDGDIRCLLTFLALRPGDTDADHFANYTPEQLAFCAQHAEALACYVAERFGGGEE